MTQKETEYYLYCGIKLGWHDKTFADYTNDEKALKMVRNYIRKSDEFVNDGLGMYLWGSNGTGKSHLLNCAFKRFIEKGYTVRLFSMDELVDKYTSSWYSDEQKQDLTKILRDVQFLGIDEFGKNVDLSGEPLPIPDFVKRVIESVVRYRVQMKRPLWITSNTEPKYVKKVFSEDVASLLSEAVVTVCVTGGDFRKTIASRNKRKLM